MRCLRDSGLFRVDEQSRILLPPPFGGGSCREDGANENAWIRDTKSQRHRPWPPLSHKGRESERPVGAARRRGCSCSGANVPQGRSEEAGLLGRLQAGVDPAHAVRFHRVPCHDPEDVFALRTFKGPQVAAGGRAGFDAGQHHAALTSRATRPVDRNHRWFGMVVRIGHVMHPIVMAGAQHSQSPLDAGGMR
jgi:hypothetical protein